MPANVRRDPPPRKGVLERFTVLIRPAQRRTLTLRRHRHLATEEYAGKVHCFTVPTGAYVTRRRGRIAVQGNSVFWHAAMRSTWYLKKLPARTDTLQMELYHRKSNSGRLQRPVAYTLAWDASGRATIVRGEVQRAAPLLARIASTLERIGEPMTAMELALAVGPGHDGKQPTEGAIKTMLARDKGKTCRQVPGTLRWAPASSDPNEDTPLLAPELGAAAEGSPAGARGLDTPEDTSGVSSTSLSGSRAPRSEQSAALPESPHSFESEAGVAGDQRAHAPAHAGSAGPEINAGNSPPTAVSVEGERTIVDDGRDILEALRRQDIAVYLDAGGQPHVKSNGGLVDAGTLELLRSYRPAVVAALEAER